MYPQAFNRYSYCLNNPLKYVDLSGHDLYLALLQHFANKPTIETSRTENWLAIDMYYWWMEAEIIIQAYGMKQAPTPAWTIGESDIHTGLDVGGFINPGADIANAGIYAAEGDYENAIWSGIASVPFIGDGIKLAKRPIKWIINGLGNILGIGKKAWTVEKIF